ncbi:MAG: 4'-phosphopantetheinyl transferase superfamily protein, partial [Candidatus Acidiferrales bacterium]
MKNKHTREKEAWFPSRSRRTILQGEVHVWRIALDVNGEGIQAARDVLSEDEIEKADRFRFELDRRRFAIAHAGMRKILAGYLGCDAKQLIFEYDEKGKPRLRDTFNARELNFNLSHSGQLSLLAVAPKISVGIDIETVNPKFTCQEIAGRFLSRDEIRNLLTLPEEQRTEAFFTCWTRKEAYIKARGDGLSIPLNSFSVT